MVEANRNAVFALAKGIGIILVVFGHCIQYGNGQAYENTAAFFHDPLFILIYSFHMPLFVLISGFFCTRSVRTYSWTFYIKNKVLQLILPIFYWSILYKSVELIGNQEKTSENFGLFLKQWINYFFSSQWFLWAVFLYSILFTIAYYLFHDATWLYGVFFFIAFLLQSSSNSVNITLMQQTSPLFLIGYLVGRRYWCDKRHFNTSSWEEICIAILIYVFAMLFKQKADIANQYAMNRMLYVICRASGSILLIILIQKSYEKWNKQVAKMIDGSVRKRCQSTLFPAIWCRMG